MPIAKRHRRPERPYPSVEAWRRAHSLNKAAASALLGISPAFYGKIERGDLTPGKQTGKHISDVTGVPIETVLGIA